MNAELVARLGLVPLNDAARNGRNQLVFADDRYALVRWIEDCWLLPSGQPWRAAATHYKPGKD